MTQSVSKENKLVARHVAEAFGGKPQVREYLHDSEPLIIDIMWCEDRPVKGVIAYSTIGLSDYPMRGAAGEFPTRLELAGSCAGAAAFFPNILATAAFSIMRTGTLHQPGTVMPNFVRQYSPSSPLPHLYLTAPFLWEGKLTTLDCGTKKVSWLLAVPIAESEYLFRKEHGDKALEQLLEKNNVDIFDLNRPPAV